MYEPSWYGPEATVAKFLLGGIGAGNISINTRGQLCDWEIFGKPNVGYAPPYTFFAIRTQDEDGAVTAKLLESEFVPPYEASHGIYSWQLGGMPRFRDSRMRARCSRAELCLVDETVPVQVSLEAFSPLLPLDPERSGLPALMMRYCVENPTDRAIDVSVCASVCNLVGFAGKELFGGNLMEGNPFNTVRTDGHMTGIYYQSDLDDHDLRHGTMALTAPHAEASTSVKRAWLNGNWWDGIHDFWHDFTQDGVLETESHCDAIDSRLTSNNGKLMVGSVCQKQTIAPGKRATFTFLLAWHFPNRLSRWEGHVLPPEYEANAAPIRVQYATRFADAWQVASYFAGDMARLQSASRLFEDALYASTLPSAMVDALAANITVLRSTTCFWLENGKFFGWEGTFNHRGSCEGNCTHVWNYAQTMAYLFPTLEQDMRRTEFLLETDADGDMAFRASRALGNRRFDLYPPAADGQMGCVIRLYREWKLSGDDTLLRELWDSVKRVMHFAMTHWDTDGDFVLDAMQHNTYDVEFYGINPLTNGIFFAALLAAAEMADTMGDTALAATYHEGWRKGSAKLDALLFNGSYYVQRLDHPERYKYQVGGGCLSDQLLGQTLAHLSGLGYVLPKAHVQSAVHAIFENNFLSSLREHVNVQRAYAVGDEAGLLMCAWPDGGRPSIPFPYCDEIWSGVEYQVATHLIYEGRLREAEQIVEAVRNRHNGINRNPWNEVECGNHYARSMASWGLLIAMSGYHCAVSEGYVSFSPQVQGDFQCFFSTAKSWGIYRQKVGADGTLDRSIEILYGDEALALR